MDLAAWLWERVERRDAPAVLAHALSLAPTRDAILRQAAINGKWDHLAAASAEAADVARHVGWARSGPDAVTAICHWIAADRTLRSIPENHRAAPLAQSALAAWSAPGELASRLAASVPLSATHAADFEQALSDDAAWLQEIDRVEELMLGDPEAARDLLENDQTRTVLLRHAARTGEWEDLAALATDTEERERADGSASDGARQVAQLSEWMADTGTDVGHEPLSRAELADSIALSPRNSSIGADAATGEPKAPRLGGLDAPTAAPGPDAAPGLSV